MALLTDAQIDAQLAERPGWVREGEEIVRRDELRDFAAALAFVNRVGTLAEERNHHPDITIHGWNKVMLRVTNHSAGGLTAADFELAAAIDGL